MSVRDNGILPEEEKQFNFSVSSTRIITDHAFHLLKIKIRRLGHFECTMNLF